VYRTVAHRGRNVIRLNAKPRCLRGSFQVSFFLERSIHNPSMGMGNLRSIKYLHPVHPPVHRASCTESDFEQLADSSLTF
jgi:hypothetical protein